MTLVHSPSAHTQPDKSKTVADLPAHEAACLSALAEEYSETEPCYLPFASVMELTGLDRTQVKRAVRRLAGRGFALFRRGLWSEDGQPCGSGYCCSPAGYAASGVEERYALRHAALFGVTTAAEAGSVGTKASAEVNQKDTPV